MQECIPCTKGALHLANYPKQAITRDPLLDQKRLNSEVTNLAKTAKSVTTNTFPCFKPDIGKMTPREMDPSFWAFLDQLVEGLLARFRPFSGYSLVMTQLHQYTSASLLLISVFLCYPLKCLVLYMYSLLT